MKLYDLVVIGSGPAGEKAAAKAAYFGLRVALVEQESHFGGTVLTGGLPSKALRETAVTFSEQIFQRSHLESTQAIEKLMLIKDETVKAHAKEVYGNLKKHKINIYRGTASFITEHQIHIQGDFDTVIEGKYILIATGMCTEKPDFIPFDGIVIHDVLTITNMKKIPESITIIGAGPIGCEFSTIFSALGSKVYLVSIYDNILPFLDDEITQKLIEIMSENKVNFLFKYGVIDVTAPKKVKDNVVTRLSGEETLHTEMFLYTKRQKGNIKDLNLSNVGVETDENGIIKVNRFYQTNKPHIFSAGDVVGFPALASTSMDQGRVVVSKILNINDLNEVSNIIPHGVWTIPEIASVGLSEQKARAEGIEINTGLAHYIDFPRGKLLGEKKGVLKLVYRVEDHVIIGVHILGNLATEIIHHGVDLIKTKSSLLDVIQKVYNFPTLHDLYKYAAYDALGKK